MDYKRIHVRVPINREALLSGDKGSYIKAHAIDISQGGVAITEPETALTNTAYDITITTPNGQKIDFCAELIRREKGIVGFKTVEISDSSLQIISDLVFQYQETTDFIKQIDEHNILDQHFVDDEGNEFDITFDVDPDEK